MFARMRTKKPKQIPVPTWRLEMPSDETLSSGWEVLFIRLCEVRIRCGWSDL